ncbi:MAG: hypothetical protein ACRD9S_10025, partial [Pyrinomonadaceae bacterium]
MQRNSRFEKSTNKSAETRKLILLSLTFAVGVIAAIAGFAAAAPTQRQQARVVNAKDFPGQDLGAKINAADKALGTGSGEIVVKA